MSTKKQNAANRRNAGQSTGPKTPEGKAASSMNALRHGLRARAVVLWDEEQADFDEIFDGLQDLYQPQNPAEQHLVDQAAIAQWKLVRAEIYEAKCSHKAPTIEARSAVFCKMTLVTSRLDRAYTKAYKELERIKAAREEPPEPPQEPAKEKPANEEPSTEKSSKEKDKEKKEMDDMGGPNLDVFWVNPETGVRDYLYRRRDGKGLPQGATPNDDPAKKT